MDVEQRHRQHRNQLLPLNESSLLVVDQELLVLLQGWVQLEVLLALLELVRGLGGDVLDPPEQRELLLDQLVDSGVVGNAERDGQLGGSAL